MRSLGWKQLVGRIIHGNICHWLVMKKSSIFNVPRSAYFQILYCVWERWTRTHNQILHGEDRLMWFRSSSEYKAFDTIDGEPMEFEWNIFQGFTTLQFWNKDQEFLSKMSEEPEEFTGRILFMSMFNDIPWGSQDNERECDLSANLVSFYARRFTPGRWSFLGPGSEKWYSIHDSKPQGDLDRIAELMMFRRRTLRFPFYESTLQRNAQKQRCWKIIKTLLRLMRELFFVQLLMIISSGFTEQSQICVMNTESPNQELGDLLW